MLNRVKNDLMSKLLMNIAFNSYTLPCIEQRSGEAIDVYRVPNIAMRFLYNDHVYRVNNHSVENNNLAVRLYSLESSCADSII